MVVEPAGARSQPPISAVPLAKGVEIGHPIANRRAKWSLRLALISAVYLFVTGPPALCFILQLAGAVEGELPAVVAFGISGLPALVLDLLAVALGISAIRQKAAPKDRRKAK